MKTIDSHYEKTSGFEKLIGYVLIIGSVIMLVFSQRATRGLTKASADMTANFVRLADTTSVLPENDGKMVYFSAYEQTDESVTDPLYGVGGHYLALSRVVEYYQWVETSVTTKHKYKDEVEETTEYSYSKGWTNEPVNSRSFDDSRYKNKAPLVIDARTKMVKDIKMGAYTLGEDIRMNAARRYNKILDHGVDMATASMVLADASEKMKVHLLDKVIYYGEDPAHPAIGDVRVSFQATEPGVMYILAKVDGNTLVPYLVSELSEKKFKLAPEPIDTDEFLQYDTEGAGYLILTIRIIAWLLIVWAVHELRGCIVYPLRKKSFISRIIPEADNKLTLWAVGTYLSVVVIVVCHILSCITS